MSGFDNLDNRYKCSGCKTALNLIDVHLTRNGIEIEYYCSKCNTFERSLNIGDEFRIIMKDIIKEVLKELH